MKAKTMGRMNLRRFIEDVYLVGPQFMPYEIHNNEKVRTIVSDDADFNKKSGLFGITLKSRA